MKRSHTHEYRNCLSSIKGRNWEGNSYVVRKTFSNIGFGILVRFRCIIYGCWPIRQHYCQSLFRFLWLLIRRHQLLLWKRSTVSMTDSWISMTVANGHRQTCFFSIRVHYQKPDYIKSGLLCICIAKAMRRLCFSVTKILFISLFTCRYAGPTIYPRFDNKHREKRRVFENLSFIVESRFTQQSWWFTSNPYNTSSILEQCSVLCVF